jgi:carbonic anhydrase
VTPQKALQFLREGNERFLNNLRINRNLLQLVNETADQQFPFACILSCSDSRVSNELIFDQGLGDIFSIRLAGNIASVNAIGSMEYACKILGSKLIMVMGHTNCGAVKGACDGVSLENLDSILQQILLALDAEKDTKVHRHSGNKSFVENVARLNVLHNMELITKKSTIIKNLVECGEIDLIGAMYDVETGRAEFFSDQDEKTSFYETEFKNIK